jgi:hypothetical protein
MAPKLPGTIAGGTSGLLPCRGKRPDLSWLRSEDSLGGVIFSSFDHTCVLVYSCLSPSENAACRLQA